MANWFVVVGDGEKGPFSDAQLKQLAAAGKLTPRHQLRREDMQQPVAAAKLRGLFGEHVASTEPGPTVQAAPSGDEPAHAATPITAGDVLRNASRKLAQNAKWTKLAKHDLPAAEQALGAKVLELRIGSEAFAELYAQIDELATQADELSRTSQAAEHETLGDKAKRVAADGKRRVKAEGLLLKRKKLIGELGRQALENNDVRSDQRLAA